MARGRNKDYIKPADVTPSQTKRVLEFLNSARTAEEIANAIEIPGEADVGVGLAEKILEEREERGEFTNLKQLDEIRGIGPERFTELVTTLGKNPAKVDDNSYPYLKPFIGIVRSAGGGYLVKGEIPKSAKVSERLTTLSPLASEVLFRCDGTKTFHMIVDELTESLGRPFSQMRREAEHMVIGSLEAGFLKIISAPLKSKAVILDGTGGAPGLNSAKIPYIDGVYAASWCSGCAACAACSACAGCAACGACLVTPPPIVDLEVTGLIAVDTVAGVGGVVGVAGLF